MKKMIKFMTVVAVAAMGLTACQNEFDEPNRNSDQGDVIVTFVAEPEATRTSVDTSSDEAPVFSWNDNETFVVLEQTDVLAAATNVAYERVDGKAHITATFNGNAGRGEYKYVTVYPASAYVEAENINATTLTLPSNQTMAEGSYDPNADLMVSKVVTADVQPTEAQQVRFTRVAAVVKMTLKNLGIEAGDAVEKVIFTAEGKSLAGTITADLNMPHEFTVNEGVSSVSVATTSNTDVYFNVLPTALVAGDSYTVTVITTKHLYIKSGTIPEDKTLTLEGGMVNRFSVNMMTATVSDKWVLVKDASTLKEGDIITFAAKDYDKAISTKLYSNASETSTSARRGAEDISKFNNYLIANENVQPFTLVSGATEGSFSFYDTTRAKFLVSTNKSSRYLINQPYIDNNTSFSISIVAEDGDATVKNVHGDYADNMIRYYNSSKYFYSGTSTNQAICIYQLAGGVGTIPTVAANITVPDTDEYVIVAEEGVAEAIAIENVVFNYVGNWTITPTTNVDWLGVAYDVTNNCLTYTAEPNTSTKRDAVVTITASLDNEESLTWTFNVRQKGMPEEITIAEFITKDKDVDSAYKLTGLVTSISSSNGHPYTLEDEAGNVATITYLYTDSDEEVYGNDAIGLEVGDIVTVTTVVATSTKGKGGSSSYHSIYKGHYGLTITAGLAAEYTGGSVNIGIETRSNGDITAPEVVTATMAECDFAELTYDGSDTATVTFANENTTSDALEVDVTFTYGRTSATITAVQGVNPANKLGWRLVTDASTLAVGDEVIIAAIESDKALGQPSSKTASSYSAKDITKTGDVIYDIEDTGVVVFTLVEGAKDGTMAFSFTYTDDTTRYLSATSSTGLRSSDAIKEATSSFTISIEATNGDASIASDNKLVKYNSSSSGFTGYAPSNSNATKAANAVAIYKKETKQ